MKLLHLEIALVVLMFCSLTGATQVVNDNEDLRETIKSLQKTVESLQVNFDLTHALERCSKVLYRSIAIQVTNGYNVKFFSHIWLVKIWKKN